MSNVVNYTKMRKGQKTGRKGEKIEVCPLCHRNGIIDRFNGVRGPWGQCTHAGEIQGMFFSVTDRCMLNDELLKNVR